MLKWYDKKGKNSDVVLSSRIRLARNTTEYPFSTKISADEGKNLVDRVFEDEDIYLDEFRDEIDGWVIDAIKSIGIDTAKAVLNAPRELLIEKTDLEEETVDEVLRILSLEFEEGEPELEPAPEVVPETEPEVAPEAEPEAE